MVTLFIVAVEIQVIGAFTAQKVGPDTARHIAHARLLHLDDLCAQVSKSTCRYRAGDGLRHLQDSNALKRGCHERSASKFENT